MKCELCGQDFDIVYKTCDSNINNFRNACLTCIVERQKLLGTIYHPSIKKGLLDYNLMCALTEIDMKEKNSNSIEGLIEHELYEANQKFPQFQSRHEAFAVMLEEYEELTNEIEDIETGILEDYWNNYCKNSKANLPNVDTLLDCLDAGIICAIKELIQLGAMVRKAKMFEKEDGENNE